MTQPSDENALIGCEIDYPYPNPKLFSYMTLNPHPRASPVDFWGNGIGGILVDAKLQFQKEIAMLDCKSGSERHCNLESSLCQDGGLAVFTDMTVVPMNTVDRLHRIIFTVTQKNEEGEIVKVATNTSSESYLGFVKMTLKGHDDIKDQIAGQPLSTVQFSAVDNENKSISSIRSPVSAIVFNPDGSKFAEIAAKISANKGKVNLSSPLCNCSPLCKEQGTHL